MKDENPAERGDTDPSVNNDKDNECERCINEVKKNIINKIERKK